MALAQARDDALTARISGLALPQAGWLGAARADAVAAVGLLFAATEIGVFVSFDDGAKWETLQLNLPRSSVRDLRVQGNDIVVATHGRSFWVLDDIASLRQLHDSITTKRAHLFTPSDAYRFAGGRGGGRNVGENPYSGAVIDYWFKEAPKEPVSIEFLDARGAVVRRFKAKSPAKPDSASASAATVASKTAKDSVKAPVSAVRTDSLAYFASDSIVQTRAGSNRFTWNLRYADAKRAKNVVNPCRWESARAQSSSAA